MKAKSTLILLGIVVILIALVYAFEFRKPREYPGKSKHLSSILEVKEEDINKIEIDFDPPEKLVYIKDSKGQWKPETIAHNIQISAKDHKAISDLLSQTMSRSIQSTLKEHGGLAEYGLDKPKVAVTFHIQDGSAKKIIIGKEVPIGSYVYIKEASSEDIHTIPSSILSDFSKLITKR